MVVVVISAMVLVAAAAVLAAGAFVVLAVVVTVRLGGEDELARKQSLNRRVRVARNAAVKLDVRLVQRGFRAAADTAANQSVNVDLLQNIRQSAVTAAVAQYVAAYEATAAGADAAAAAEALAALQPGTPEMHGVLAYAAETSFQTVAVIPVATTTALDTTWWSSRTCR